MRLELASLLIENPNIIEAMGLSNTTLSEDVST